MALKNSGGGSAWEELVETSAAVFKRRGIFMDITGLEGSGKSSLALTLAHLGPIGYINIDQSLDRAKQPESKKARKGVRVHTVSYASHPDESKMKTICGQVWNEMNAKVIDAATNCSGVVVDTATEDWELLRLGSFGTVTPKGRTDRLYGPVNAKFRTHLRQVTRTHGKHLVTITQLKDEYKDKMVNGSLQSMKTGKYVPVGFKEMGYLADVRIRCFKERGKSGSEFKATIEHCKLPPNGPSIEGMELEEEQLDFARIVALATGTQREEWL